MTRRTRKQRGGFSLLELVIVIVIVGIIAAIAIPRMSRGSAGAADSALTGDLAVMRNAIDLYAVEHGSTFPDVDDISDQFLQYTDAAGDAQAAKDATHIYGPYLRKIPPLPVGAKKGKTGIDDATGDDVGWIYTEATGEIKSNTTDSEKDTSDVAYNTY